MSAGYHSKFSMACALQDPLDRDGPWLNTKQKITRANGYYWNCNVSLRDPYSCTAPIAPWGRPQDKTCTPPAP